MTLLEAVLTAVMLGTVAGTVALCRAHYKSLLKVGYYD